MMKMITLKGSRFIVSYDENYGEHNVFVSSKDGCNGCYKIVYTFLRRRLRWKY